MAKVKIILPDFIIIGANKAGTTSVANYLNSHPSIKISDVKEPMFFSSDPVMTSAGKKEANLKKPFFTSTLERYSDLFSNHEYSVKIFGEASTSYLAIPKRSAFLIKKIVPKVKIIAVLREPVDRAISAYKMCYGNGIEKRSFSQIVQDSLDHTSILHEHGVKEYVRNGLYDQLLGAYFTYFDRSQILILNYDELVSKPDVFMHKILRFLRLKNVNFDMKKKYNTEKDHLKQKISIDENAVNVLKKIYIREIEELNSKIDIPLDRWLSYLKK
jgi:hypothetical protein